jgi:hypothetical protein
VIDNYQGKYREDIKYSEIVVIMTMIEHLSLPISALHLVYTADDQVFILTNVHTREE